MFPSPLILPGYVYNIIRLTSEISERNEKQDGGIEEKEIVVSSFHPVILIDEYEAHLSKTVNSILLQV